MFEFLTIIIAVVPMVLHLILKLKSVLVIMNHEEIQWSVETWIISNESRFLFVFIHK